MGLCQFFHVMTKTSSSLMWMLENLDRCLSNFRIFKEPVVIRKPNSENIDKNPMLPFVWVHNNVWFVISQLVIFLTLLLACQVATSTIIGYILDLTWNLDLPLGVCNIHCTRDCEEFISKKSKLSMKSNLQVTFSVYMLH